MLAEASSAAGSAADSIADPVPAKPRRAPRKRDKSAKAVTAALQISAVAKTVNVELKNHYPNTGYVMRQTIGVDTGKLLVARTGVWKHNDLVWVGAAANYAAKLCQGGSTTHPVRITERVYKALNATSKLGGNPARDMWETVSLQTIGVQCYQTNWTWDF